MRVFTLLATVGLPLAAAAQADGAAPAPVQGEAATPPAAAPPAPIDCAPKAAAYRAEKGMKLWLMRQGSMVLAENPLRPLARDEAVVLDVVVNGRRATAFGLDFDNLHQGGTPKSVERLGREPIAWKEAAVAPSSLRVVAEDGRILLGPMPFAGCEDAPAAKPVVDKPVAAEKPAKPRKGQRKPKQAAPSPDSGGPSRLPQGALSNPSLSR